MKLDLGCGKSKHPNSIGLDMNLALLGPDDVCFEIKDRFFLPFKDDSFSQVYMYDIVEHICDVPWLLSEVHRVAKPNAQVKIRYPHYSCRGAYGDVTHVNKLNLHAFEHFDPITEMGKKYQYYTMFKRNFPYKIEKTEVAFSSKLGGLPRLIYNTIGMDNYERILANFIPIGNVTLDLRVLKE